jgi:hypothetical protein
MHMEHHKDFLCVSACTRVLAYPRAIARARCNKPQGTSQQLNSIYCEFLRIRLETHPFDIRVQTLFSG